jgi:hypothetical protein
MSAGALNTPKGTSVIQLLDDPSAEVPPHIVNYPLWVGGIPYATCACHWWWQLVEVGTDEAPETRAAS